MNVELSQILPVYFSAEQAKGSGIWMQNISIQAGEHLEIVAPSGSGKTSLIHFLYGMRRDYKGSILYNGNALEKSGHEELARLRAKELSVVFQDMRLFPSQTVRENIEIKRQLSPFHQPGKTDEMASRLGLTEKMDRSCGTCSYGEQQRAAIIRALMQPFEILLLDEPFSHLDNANARKAMELILEEAALRKATVVLADLERTEFFPNTRSVNL